MATPYSQFRLGEHTLADLDALAAGLGGVRTDVTNLNGYDFENNLWTMRVEERVGLLVERPELFELVAITGAGS